MTKRLRWPTARKSNRSSPTPHPPKQLAGFVHLAAQINERTAAIYRIAISAAASDTDAVALLHELTLQRQKGQERIARSLASAKALRPGLRQRNAADIIHALVSPEVFGLLSPIEPGRLSRGLLKLGW